MFDRYASVFFLVLGVSIFFYSQTLTVSTGGAIGPKELPLFLSVALMIMSALNLMFALRAKPVAGKAGLEHRKFLVILGLLVAYIFLLEPVGYVISTFVFLVAAFQTMERGNLWKSVVIAAAFAGGVYYIYVNVALGVLPGLPFIDQ